MTVPWPRRLALELVRIAHHRPLAVQPLRTLECRSFHRIASERLGRAPKLAGPKARNDRIHGARSGLLAASGLLSLLFAISLPTSNLDSSQPGLESSGPTPDPPVDSRDPSKPRFRLSEVRQHDGRSPEPWVISGDKVYDITDWVSAHPGGEVILRAAGGSIDPYWEVFSIHKVPYVREILEQYMIGFIDVADLVDGKAPGESVEGLFKDDPERDERLITHTVTPRNAETPNDELSKEFLTPNDLFYVRHHMWVPVVGEDAEDYSLSVELPDGEVRKYTMDELRSRFRTHKVTAVLQCSGNRRSDMSRQVAKTNGLPWGVGAISNAEWEGVRLSDVLADAGLITGPTSNSPAPDGASDDQDEQPDPATLHVQFSALEGYGASIPLPTALDPRNEVLLAFGMNGQPLPRDHGYPLRALVPGHVAARSVKWLSKIVVADEESTSQWQRRDYKCFGPNEGDKPDWDRYPSIQEMPITSAVTGVWVGECVRKSKADWMRRMLDNQSSCKRAPPGTRDVKAWQKQHMQTETGEKGEPVAVAGYAYSGGGREVVRVDVSVDGGRTWDQAELLEDGDGEACQGGKAWSWKRWRYTGSLPPLSSCTPKTDEKGGMGSADACTEIVVKATDSSYNTQPEHHAYIFNVRGNLATAWHRVRVCPTCVATEDGKKTWHTGDGVYGCGFR